MQLNELLGREKYILPSLAKYFPPKYNNWFVANLFLYLDNAKLTTCMAVS